MLNVEMHIRNTPEFSVLLEISREYKIQQQSTTVTKQNVPEVARYAGIS